MKLRPSRQSRRGRIEIIPMIDVMFFLLATFMLASLALQNLHSLTVNMPRGQAPLVRAAESVTMTVTRDGQILINQAGVTLDTLVAAPSGTVVQALLKARDAGAEHFLFAIQPR